MLQVHIAAICVGCRTTQAYSTPIPCTLVTFSGCGACGHQYMVGITGGFLCDQCKHLHYEADARIAARDASS